jgi:hypothetical protein
LPHCFPFIGGHIACHMLDKMVGIIECLIELLVWEAFCMVERHTSLTEGSFPHC